MNKVSEQRMKLRIEYSRETDLIFSDNIPAYADWLEKKLALSQHDVSGEVCVKCGKSFMPRLFKERTICDSCYDKLAQTLC